MAPHCLLLKFKFLNKASSASHESSSPTAHHSLLLFSSPTIFFSAMCSLASGSLHILSFSLGHSFSYLFTKLIIHAILQDSPHGYPFLQEVFPDLSGGLAELPRPPSLPFTMW